MVFIFVKMAVMFTLVAIVTIVCMIGVPDILGGGHVRSGYHAVGGDLAGCGGHVGDDHFLHFIPPVGYLGCKFGRHP